MRLSRSEQLFCVCPTNNAIILFGKLISDKCWKCDVHAEASHLTDITRNSTDNFEQPCIVPTSTRCTFKSLQKLFLRKMRKNRKKAGKFIVKTASKRYNFIFKGIYCGRSANNLRHNLHCSYEQIQWERQTNATFYCSYTRLNENVFALPSPFAPSRLWCGGRSVFVVCLFSFHMFVRPQSAIGDIFAFYMCTTLLLYLCSRLTFYTSLTVRSESVPFCCRRLHFHHSNSNLSFSQRMALLSHKQSNKTVCSGHKDRKRKVFLVFASLSTSASIFPSTFCFIACTTS